MGKRTLILCCLMTWLFSCNKINKEIIGPEICPSDQFNNADLTMNGISNNATIDFVTNDYVPFYADFAGEKVTWTITIEGRTSGAKTIMNGYSSKIDTLWYGLSSNGISYKTEICTVTYKIACKDPIYKNITINTVTDYANIPYIVLLSNFDGQGKITATSVSGNNSDISNYSNGPWYWSGNADQSTNYEFDFFVPQITAAIKTDSVEPSPAGGNYLRLVGDRTIKNLSNTYYFGEASFVWNYSSFTGWLTNPKNLDVYVNMWIKTANSTPNSQLQISLVNYGSNLAISKLLSPTKEWKLVSWKLTDHELNDYNNIQTFSIGLGSAPNKGMSAVAYIDQISLSTVPLGEVIPK